MSLVESAPPREWGTRYDSLSTSPSPSTASSLSRIPPTASNSLLPPSVTVTPAQTHTQVDQASHEASVFVGSLPTNVDHAELSARLKDHLSAFVHVNLVRIIRDSRGGVCAFVQCDDSTSAAQLIQKVRSLPPQNFMGRHLRFEPARSQRTLWVSYRKPVEVIRDADHGRSASNGRIVEFDLPTAMRICRIPGSKRVNILYNAQALHLDSNTGTPVPPSPQEQDPSASVLTGVGLILSPLLFDSQTLHRIACFFGPLETFDHRPPESAEESTEFSTYSYPHNADKSVCMDPGCWEIKWVNRNDCLSALATLRSVPHLTVTWPNQHHALIPRRSGLFCRSHQMKDHLATKRQSSLHQVHPPNGDNDNTTGRITSLGPSSSWNHRVNTIAATLGSQSPPERLSSPNLPIITDDWTIVDARSNPDFSAPPNVPHTLASEHLQSHACDVPPETEENRENQKDELLCIDGVPSDSLEWSGVVSNNAARSKNGVATISPVSPLHVPVHDGDPQSPPPCSALSPPFIENLASPFVPKSLEPSYPLSGSAFNFYDTFAIPPAPQWSEVRPRSPTGTGDENIDANLHNVLDPTTIFVGGLDVHGRCTWDEQRLKRVFGQYGEIAEVKLVRPAHRKSAFAFVTYKNNKSSSRAVLAEHGRIYDGRHIRVQLRDSAVQKVYGSKSNLKLSEGRPFSPRHQIDARINGSPVDSLPHGQNGIGPGISFPGEELVPAHLRSPSGATSLHPDSQGQAQDNTCVPLIPSQASSTMLSGPPPMTYPPPPPTAFYAPTPWFVHPYPYVPGPPPHIVPGYPPIPLTPSVVGANEASQPISSNTMYQPMPHYSVYPLPLHPIPLARQQHIELTAERRAPLQPTGFIESEQGLIPVYAPEALGEYMASANSQQNTSEPGGTHPVLHPQKVVPETRPSQPRTMYTTYPQPQYHPTFVRDRGAFMMAAPSQFPNAPNVMPVGPSFNWYPDTIPAEHRVQGGPRAAAAHALPVVETHPSMHIYMGPPLQGQISGERGLGFSRRRGQMDRSFYARTTRGSNPPGMHSTRRKGYFKHAGGAVSMSAVTDQTPETGLGDVASVVEPVVRASTSSPAVFDLTPASPKR